MYIPTDIFSLAVIGDDELFVYDGGELILTSGMRVNILEYDPDPCVLALAAFNTGGIGGILAETSTGVVTDESWKCSLVNETGWHLTSFDDSGWDYAWIIQPHGAVWWPTYPGISLEANWIWPTNYTMTRDWTTAHCRKRLACR